MLKRVRSRKSLRGTPVVTTTQAELSAREETVCQPYADALTLTRPGSLDQVLDAVALFLHRSDVRPARGRRPGRRPAAGGRAACSSAGGS